MTATEAKALLKQRFPKNLSKHFAAWEFLFSNTMPEIAKTVTPTPQEWNNMLVLARLVLEPIREEYGPLSITSGFRPKILNDKVGGSPTSQHVNGTAVDVVGGRGVTERVYLDMEGVYPGQMFYYKKRGHLHLGLPQLGIPVVHKVFDK